MDEGEKKMKTIILKIDNKAFENIKSYMAIRKMCGQNIGIDYEFILLIIKGILDKRAIIVIEPKGEKK